MTLTKIQKKTLDFLKNYIHKNGYSPTIEETKKHLGLSSSGSAHNLLKELEKKGYIKKEKNQPRGIKIMRNSNDDIVHIPLLGNIAAGEPIEAINETETIGVEKSLLTPSSQHYALRVKGNSMIEDSICDGDIVIIKEQTTANNNDTVVAFLNNDEVTLKKIFKEKDGFRLQPANRRFKPIYTKELAIQGKVVQVIRYLKDTVSAESKKEKLAPKCEISKDTRDIKKYLNTVYLGDVMDLLKELPDNSVDMIFGDPDYNVGIKYNNKTYTKNFNEYINWYIELTKEAMRVLKEDGNLFMMNYPKQNAHLRVKYLDNEYPDITENVWVYNTNVGHSPKRFTTAHRTILHVCKSKNNRFYKNNIALPYKNPTDKRIQQNLINGSKGRMPYTWYYFDLVKNVSKEKTYHSCQIPQKLTEMLIKATTEPGDIVFPLFGGSGSELEVAKKLGRQYISAELDSKYHELILHRLENGYIDKKYKLPNGKKIKQAMNPILPLFAQTV